MVPGLPAHARLVAVNAALAFHEVWTQNDRDAVRTTARAYYAQRNVYSLEGLSVWDYLDWYAAPAGDYVASYFYNEVRRSHSRLISLYPTHAVFTLLDQTTVTLTLSAYECQRSLEHVNVTGARPIMRAVS